MVGRLAAISGAIAAGGCSLLVDAGSADATVTAFGSRFDEQPVAVAIDSESSTIVCGQFEDSFDLGHLRPGTTLSVIDPGDTDIYVAKLNTKLDLEWANAYGGLTRDACRAIAVGEDDEVYVVGEFVSGFGLGPDERELMPTQPQAGVELFVLRIDRAGQLEWAIADGTAEDDSARAVALANERVIVAATMRDAALSPRAYLIRYDRADGVRQGDSTIIGGPSTQIERVQVAGDSIFVGGVLSGAVGLGCNTPTISATAFVARFAGNSTSCQWARLLPTENPYLGIVAIGFDHGPDRDDPADDALVVAGNGVPDEMFPGRRLGTEGQSVIARLDTENGAGTWVRQLGAEGGVVTGMSVLDGESWLSATLVAPSDFGSGELVADDGYSVVVGHDRDGNQLETFALSPRPEGVPTAAEPKVEGGALAARDGRILVHGRFKGALGVPSAVPLTGDIDSIDVYTLAIER